MIADVAVIGIVEVGRRLLGVAGDYDQLLRRVDRQQTQDHRVNQREDGGVSAEAQCERQNRNGGERRIPDENAQGVADIGQDGSSGMNVRRRSR